MNLFKDIQFIHWDEKWHFLFMKSNPQKEPAAFHLIYKWSLKIGHFEIRKFMTEKERKTALDIYYDKIK